jgi:hypothetical protein
LLNSMSDFDAVIMFVRDHTRPLTRGALATRIWEARGGTREDWLRRIDTLVEGGALESRLWPGAARMVKTHRIFPGTRTVEYACRVVAERLHEERAARARERAHARAGDARAPGRGDAAHTDTRPTGRMGRVSTW